MTRGRPRISRARCLVLAMLWAAGGAQPALGAERELDDAPAPGSASEIRTPIQQVFPKDVPEQRPLIPWIREQLQDLPAFLADTRLEARFRTYYLRKDRTSDMKSEAWAIGGSIYYRSGWLADVFQAEAEAFTSQPLVAPNSRSGTLLLEPVQDGYSVVGIANAKLRYQGLVLTGYRQYLDLPYINRRDNRMTPNTFESLTLAKPEGPLRLSAGYTWKIKTNSSDQFRSFPEVLGVNKDRGLAHGGVIWEPNSNLRVGALGAVIPDLIAGFYGESGIGGELPGGLQGRLDGQFTYQSETGDDLAGDLVDDTWNLGMRGSGSYAGAVVRLGVSFTGNAPLAGLFGTNPSYVDLMQQTFTSEDEKALLASLSYDFSNIGAHGLSAIVNFVAAFDGKRLGVRRDAQELDLTVDYRVKKGWLNGFWLRVRGSWLHEGSSEQDGTDVRVILRYDLPVI